MMTIATLLAHFAQHDIKGFVVESFAGGTKIADERGFGALVSNRGMITYGQFKNINLGFGDTPNFTVDTAKPSREALDSLMVTVVVSSYAESK